MTTGNLERIIDGDGHIMEDIPGIISYIPEEYRGKSFAGEERGVRSPFPPIDHLHSSNRHITPPGSFANVGPDGWIDFLDEVGVDATVLYTTSGLGFGKIVSRDWAVMLARAYNNWVYDTYLSRGGRFQAMGLLPLQEPDAAVEELRRIVQDLGFVGAMLPSTGAQQPHLGDSKFWPIYAEAERLGCALGIHGGAHEGFLMDEMSPYAPINALGHPMGQMVAFAGIIFNGVFDKYPGVRIGFLEAGAAWLLTCMERFNGSWASHVQYDPRGRFLDIREGERVSRLHLPGTSRPTASSWAWKATSLPCPKPSGSPATSRTCSRPITPTRWTPTPARRSSTSCARMRTCRPKTRKP